MRRVRYETYNVRVFVRIDSARLCYELVMVPEHARAKFLATLRTTKELVRSIARVQPWEVVARDEHTERPGGN